MDVKLKADWIAALRSGKYRQGRIYFEKNNSFCCLGVLCKISGQPTELAPASDNWDFVESVIDTSEHISALIGRNDNGVPFPVIADYIEANL